MSTAELTQLLSDKILAPIGQAHGQLPEQPLVGFMSMVGQAYSGSLMVVGRAVNGWGAEEKLPVELHSSDAARAYAEAVLASVSDPANCPMSWVTAQWGVPRPEYSTKRSAFWRSIYSVLKGLGTVTPDDEGWSSHLVWSNLYKVAPASGGNPNNFLCDLQLPGCIELLRAELAAYQPRRVLFLTGLNWAKPFAQALGFPLSQNPSFSYVEAFGEFPFNGHSVRYAIASHPQGKPENTWTSEVLSVLK